MKRSVARKFFMICFICVLCSILILGVVLLAFSTRLFEKDKYNMMHHNASIAAAITANNYTDNLFSHIDETTIVTTYGILANTINADFFLVNLDGTVIYHSDYRSLPPQEGQTDIMIPSEIVEQAMADNYQNTGIFPNISESPCYIVGVPVAVFEQPVAVIFATTSANDLVVYLHNVLKMFLISAGFVLLLAFVVISYFTSRMVKPLKQMLDATHSFAKGDFSKRVPVAGYDEIGQLSMAFNNMASTLAANESSRRSFIANVSHELRTPMTTIGGFVDGILDGTIPPEKQNHYLKIVSNDVQRLSRLVHSMLDTARIEAGEMELHLTTFDISELVRQSIFSFEHNIEEKQLTMAGLEQDHVMVSADRDLLYQVVYNLVENAVKFVNQGGEISVRYEEKDGMIYTTVRNTGDGLSKEEASKIFERFYKSDRSRTTHTGGAGLGLHIVKSIIQYHEGEIYAHSLEGKYTEFTFSVSKASETKEQ